MTPSAITCNTPTKAIPPFTFFIRAKGHHAVKLNIQPWRNSFAVRCKDQQAFDFYYWLVYGMFVAKIFQPYIGGSVIPFISIKDVRSLITKQATGVCNSSMMALSQNCLRIAAAELSLQKQLQQLTALKKAFALLAFKGAHNKTK